MLTIGPYRLTNQLALAPMAGVTDRPFRQLCRRLGAGLVVAEMVTSDIRLWDSQKSRTRLPHADEPGPVSVQILGNDPEQMAQAAQQNVAMGAHLIDINMGCPAKKVCKKAAGSALMRDEALVADILAAVVEATSAPVTLKIRTGWCPETKNAVRIAELAEKTGIKALAVHGRTRACRFNGNAEYQTITEVCQSVSIPVYANGDIDSPFKAREVLESTGANGIMIGRAAQGNPWIFRDTAYFLAHDALPQAPGVMEVAANVKAHLSALHQLYGENSGVRIARKHIGWYTQALPGGSHFRKAFNQLLSASAQHQALEHYFSNLSLTTDTLNIGSYRQADAVLPKRKSGKRGLAA